MKERKIMSRAITFDDMQSNPNAVFGELTANEETITVMRGGIPTALLTPVQTAEVRRMSVGELRDELLEAESRVVAGQCLEWEEVKDRLAHKLNEE
ncbi:MAG: hypothetical protein COS85_17810 [Armatimonadetes bacterium CG07_land_8_20_14_0_80_59_28]|nr:MAG: hypothetical protein COS85_17810 [Armatimonadetes bacterium CG07_land_8_20_14_0_80_59_28]PIX46011.1 MAG: hypothetical protein COZ56_00540 [Armatimonadetes bacterium CG_4_8_14_3_um_filter_58_9]PIY41949.1 MAG: hypothetical protein COZ05_14770 [Armatimonadetes bacterium CG_4_10_14_3_um_filter_59_10]PJB64631.1 MAG: hypothetical protein CO095_14770 [Armatimonadetes bacterium CG_4_9_14_3_um_filter_58_7]